MNNTLAVLFSRLLVISLLASLLASSPGCRLGPDGYGWYHRHHRHYGYRSY
jgi:hypothetical protein